MKTKPRKIAQVKFGGKEALDEAMREGEAWVMPNNPKMIQWREEVEGAKQGKGTQWRGEREKKLDSEAFAKMMKLIQEMGWNFDVSEKDSKKMAEENKLTKKIATSLQEGCDALDDLIDEAGKFFAQLRKSPQSEKCQAMSKKLVSVVEEAKDEHRRLRCFRGMMRRMLRMRRLKMMRVIRMIRSR